MKIKYFITIFCLFALLPTVPAQKAYNLEACIERAIQANLQIQSSGIALQSAEIDIHQALQARYPNLSFNSNVGWNFGRTIDPTQNLFTTETFFNNSSTLSSSVVLYNANKISNIQKQALANRGAAEKDLEQIKKDISLQVSSVYLNILFAKENLANAETQRLQTEDQLRLLNKQIEVGNLPENDRLEIEAQLAGNDQTIIENQNILNLQFLNLKQLLRLEISEEIDIVVPEVLQITTDPDFVTFESLFENAKSNQASVSAAEFRIKSAVLNQKIVHAESMPSLVAGGNLRTDYSNKGLSVKGYEQSIVEQDIFFNNQSATIGIPQNIPIFQKTPFWDQLNNNLSYGLGVSLNIPIYSNYTIRANQQRARLNLERAQVSYDQNLETLKSTVAQAYADAKAAKMRYNATEKTRKAQAVVYDNALKRFELGNTGIFELNRLKALLETTEINHIIAKYDYIFRSRVLDYYSGKPIKLD